MLLYYMLYMTIRANEVYAVKDLPETSIPR